MKQPSVETKIQEILLGIGVNSTIEETIAKFEALFSTHQAQMREKIKKLGEESDRDDGYVTWICLEDVLAIIEEKR